MPKFAANLSMMFSELPEPERFAAASEAGFTAVEFLRPYTHPVAEVRRWLDDAGLQMVLINTQTGDARKGERGLGALPGREADFRAILEVALEYATGLGAGMIHVLAGTVPEDADAAAYEATFVENLGWAAGLAKAQGVKINLEPLNIRDAPGYLHTHTVDTRRIIKTVGSDNIFLQYDLYHMQIMQGDLVEGLRRNLDVVSHVQFSSLPGRHEPQYGEINFPLVFDAIDAMGYDGWLGCEYAPKAGTLDGLKGWGAAYGLGG